MNTKLVDLLAARWSPGALAASCGVFLVLQAPALAVDAVPFLDAPGPGYREQSARVKEPLAPAVLKPVSFMYPHMAPQPSFDGGGLEQQIGIGRSFHLRRGEFSLLNEDASWTFRAGEGEVPTGLDSPIADPLRDATAPVDSVRLPQLPEVILPPPREIDPAEAEKPPFLERLFELRTP